MTDMSATFTSHTLSETSVLKCKRTHCAAWPTCTRCGAVTRAGTHRSSPKVALEDKWAGNSPFLRGVIEALLRLETSSLLCSVPRGHNESLILNWCGPWGRGGRLERVGGGGEGGGGAAPPSPSLHLLWNRLYSGNWSRMCWFLLNSFLSLSLFFFKQI